MKDVTIIIPIHEATEETKALFKKAYDSAIVANGEDAQIIVVGPQKVLSDLKLPKTVKTVKNEDCALPKQINAAVQEVKTTYFSYLEFDDEYTPIWFKNVEAYVNENPGPAVYLPIVEVIDSKKENASIGYMNEVAWAASFSSKIGFFDTESLLNFPQVCVSGGVFDKDIFLSVGALKASMKLFYWYEYLLRTSNKSKEVFVVPKVGYKHLVGRDNSATVQEYNTIKPEEFDWWFNLAQQEYQFKNDKGKKYEE